MRSIGANASAFQKAYQKIAEEFPELLEGAAPLIADQGLAYWQKVARLAPKKKDGSKSSWGEKYARTIRAEATNTGARVYVDETDPDYMYVEMVEDGVTVWSIKNALLEGKAARRNKALYGTVFVRVPFRWKTPGMTQPSSKVKFTGTMSKDIYKKVKAGEKMGIEMGNMAGLKKMGGPMHSQYMTFRTVSEKSAGWLFPSKPATPVFEKVKKKIEQMINETIQNIIEGFLKDLQKEGV